MKKLLLTVSILAIAGNLQAFGRRAFSDPFEEIIRSMDAVMRRSMHPQSVFQSCPRRKMEVTDEALIIRIEAPGFKEEDFNIEVLKGCLEVSAERKQESKNMVSTSSFAQTFPLPVPVKAKETTASYDAGILTITMPKQEQAKPHKVAIKVTRPLKKQAEE